MSNEIILPGEIEPKLAYTIREVAGLLSVCRNTIYNLARRNELHLTRIGNSTRVLDVDLRTFLDKQPKVYP